MEKSLSIDIKENVLNQLKLEYEYYRDEYSVDYAEKFRLEFFEKVEEILPYYLLYPECRFVLTKNKIYRNMIWGNYLIVFKITNKGIDVLSLFHTKQNPKRLKRVRRIK